MLKAGLKAGIMGGIIFSVFWFLLAGHAELLLVAAISTSIATGFVAARLGGTSLTSRRVASGAGALAAMVGGAIVVLFVQLILSPWLIFGPVLVLGYIGLFLWTLPLGASILLGAIGGALGWRRPPQEAG